MDKKTLVSSKLENYFVLRLRVKIISKYQGFVPISVLYAMYWLILTSARSVHLSCCVGGVGKEAEKLSLICYLLQT